MSIDKSPLSHLALIKLNPVISRHQEWMFSVKQIHAQRKRPRAGLKALTRFKYQINQSKIWPLRGSHLLCLWPVAYLHFKNLSSYSKEIKNSVLGFDLYCKNQHQWLGCFDYDDGQTGGEDLVKGTQSQIFCIEIYIQKHLSGLCLLCHAKAYGEKQNV